MEHLKVVQQFRSRINWPTCGGHAWKDGGDMSLVWFSMLKAIRPKYTAAIQISTHRYVGLNLPAYIFFICSMGLCEWDKGEGRMCRGVQWCTWCLYYVTWGGIKQVLTRLSTSPQPCQHREQPHIQSSVNHHVPCHFTCKHACSHTRTHRHTQWKIQTHLGRPSSLQGNRGLIRQWSSDSGEKPLAHRKVAGLGLRSVYVCFCFRRQLGTRRGLGTFDWG